MPIFKQVAQAQLHRSVTVFSNKVPQFGNRIVVVDICICVLSGFRNVKDVVFVDSALDSDFSH